MKSTEKHSLTLQSQVEIVSHNEREIQRQQTIARNKQDALPVLSALTKAGFKLASLSELPVVYKNDKKPIPILLEWLPQIENINVKEEIIRALSVPWAKPEAAPVLISEFKKADDLTGLGIKWVIANALSITADGSVFPGIVELVLDPRNGRSREMLVLALGNLNELRAINILIGLLDDEEVAGHALIALGKLKAKEALPAIERFLNHPKAWVRREAKKAFKSCSY